jgi:hypothetical protein
VNIPERGKAQQFSIRLPVTVKYTQAGHYEFTGVSRDVSASGMFLDTDSKIEEGAQVEVILNISYSSRTAKWLHLDALWAMPSDSDTRARTSGRTQDPTERLGPGGPAHARSPLDRLE